MSKAEALSSLISTIYDTTLNPETWPLALEQTAAFVGGRAATLAAHDTARGEGNLMYVWGDDPDYRMHYIKELAATNPVVVTTHLACEPGQGEA